MSVHASAKIAGNFKITSMGREGHVDREIVMWTNNPDDDHPYGWFIDDDGKLQRADGWSGLTELFVSSSGIDPTVVPAESGWFAIERYSDNPEKGWCMPILAWLIAPAGTSVRAVLVPDGPDHCDMIVDDGDERYRYVWRPNDDRNSHEGEWPKDKS